MMSVAGASRTFVSRDFVDSIVSRSFDTSAYLGLALLGLTILIWVVNTFAEYLPWKASIGALVRPASEGFKELLKAKHGVVGGRGATSSPGS